MLFAVIYTGRQDSEERGKRRLSLFKKWTPPAGFEFKSHYWYADGSGGVAIVDVGSPEAMLEALGPFQAFNDFKTIPIVDASAAVPIVDKMHAWRNSVS
jgi:Domain of unknown function (DUF3303)